MAKKPGRSVVWNAAPSFPIRCLHRFNSLHLTPGARSRHRSAIPGQALIRRPLSQHNSPSAPTQLSLGPIVGSRFDVPEHHIAPRDHADELMLLHDRDTDQMPFLEQVNQVHERRVFGGGDDLMGHDLRH